VLRRGRVVGCIEAIPDIGQRVHCGMSPTDGDACSAEMTSKTVGTGPDHKQRPSCETARRQIVRQEGEVGQAAGRGLGRPDARTACTHAS